MSIYLEDDLFETIKNIILVYNLVYKKKPIKNIKDKI